MGKVYMKHLGTRQLETDCLLKQQSINDYTLSQQEYHNKYRNRKLYEIYLECFNKYMVSEEMFYKSLDIERSIIFTIEQQGELAAYCIIRDNTILLLCVKKGYRKQGLGQNLLLEAEKLIREKSYQKVMLGYNGNSYLFQGVPIEEGAQKFFEKYGYKASWTSVNMLLDLSEYAFDKIHIPKCPEHISFRYLKEQEREALLEAVSKVNPSWGVYFKRCPEPILIATEQNKIIGFEILSLSYGTYNKNPLDKAGAIGCVGVLPDYEGRGIGRRMVAWGLMELKKNGCNLVYIGYTWLEAWYEELGFKTISRQWMGEKIL